MPRLLSKYPKQMYYIVLLSWWEPAAQPCALDRSSYSRRVQKKSTAEANYFFISIPRAAWRENGAPVDTTALGLPLGTIQWRPYRHQLPKLQTLPSLFETASAIE